MKTHSSTPRSTRVVTTLLTAFLTLTCFSVSALAQAKGQRVQAELANPSNDKAIFEAERVKAAEQRKAPAPAQEEQLFATTPNAITPAGYPFTSAAGVPLEDMSAGTTQLVGPGVDDTASAVAGIGFDFWYDGVRASQFSVNANGLARLGPVAVNTAFNNETGFATTVNAPKIAPFFEDLCVGTNGKIHSKVTGAAPNRRLVVEWQNMQITRGVACSGTGSGTFQMWLHEGTGVIQFVYGSGITGSLPADGGYTIGLQSGAATNFASVTSASHTVSYVTHNFSQTNPIAEGTSYSFTPPVPAAPSDLNFTAITPFSITLNWTDNASNELGYVIYQSNDGGMNYFFVTQLPADAVSHSVSGLDPGTTYFFHVLAVSEGALSPALSGSQATAPPGALVSVQSGPWSDPATWGGSIPSAGDAVTIATGHTVTIDSSNALSVTVQDGGVLEFEDTTARTLTVGGPVTIDSGGTFRTASTGTPSHSADSSRFRPTATPPVPGLRSRGGPAIPSAAPARRPTSAPSRSTKAPRMRISLS
jgi:hypothetical protein